MAFTSLPDALARLSLKESELRKLVQEKGFQVFMAGQDEQGKKTICFKEEDIASLEAGRAAEVAPLDLPVHMDDAAEPDVAIDLDTPDELEVPMMMDDDAVELDLEEDLSVTEAAADDFEIDLDEGPESLDFDLGAAADESLDLNLAPSSDMSSESQSGSATHDKTLEFDDTLDLDGGDDTLSFDPEGDDTLSIGDDDATLEFAGSDNLELPDESFSIDNDETLAGNHELSLEDDSGKMSINDVEDEVVSRPTTEIVDEDNINIIFPIVALFCFGVIVFNGCILFGLIQDIDVDGGIAYGKNFFTSIRDFAATKFNLPN